MNLAKPAKVQMLTNVFHVMILIIFTYLKEPVKRNVPQAIMLIIKQIYVKNVIYNALNVKTKVIIVLYVQEIE
jgi:hypothetical protein